MIPDSVILFKSEFLSKSNIIYSGAYSNDTLSLKLYVPGNILCIFEVEPNLLFLKKQGTITYSRFKQGPTLLTVSKFFKIKGALHKYIWIKVFKNGPSKICGKQPLNI